MKLLFNVILAWTSVGLIAAASIIYILRLLLPHLDGGSRNWVRNLNRKLRRHHKHIGMAAVATGLAHGLLSSFSVLSLNLGTLLLVVLILLGVNFALRKKGDKGKWLVNHGILTALALILVVAHLVEVGGAMGADPILQAFGYTKEVQAAEETTTSLLVEPTSGDTVVMAVPANEKYIDGTYEGEATGFRPGLKVEVVIANGLIESVVVTDHNEVKQKYWGRPVQLIPQEIVDAQSTDVDIVSGATFTSRGIMKAVEDALSQAVAN